MEPMRSEVVRDHHCRTVFPSHAPTYFLQSFLFLLLSFFLGAASTGRKNERVKVISRIAPSRTVAVRSHAVNEYAAYRQPIVRAHALDPLAVNYLDIFLVLYRARTLNTMRQQYDCSIESVDCLLI
jgi:hypothetical protein